MLFLAEYIDGIIQVCVGIYFIWYYRNRRHNLKPFYQKFFKYAGPLLVLIGSILILVKALS